MKVSNTVKIIYGMAIVAALAFLFMFFSSIMYVQQSAAAYGMSIGDMGTEAIQYILGDSLVGLFAAFILFAAAKILEAVESLKKDEKTPVSKPISEVAEAVACAAEVVEDAPAPVAETEEWSMDKVPALYTSKSFL